VRAEEALHEREEMVRAFVETCREWIWSIDLDGRHTYCNPSVEEILGYRPEEMVGRPSFDLMHEADRKMIETNWPVWIAQQHGWKHLPIRWRHKNGTWRYLESNAVPIINPKGQLIGFRGVDRDVTDRQEAEDRLQRMEAQLAHVARLSTMGEMVAGVAHEVNQPFYSILNFAKAGSNVLTTQKQPDLESLREWIDEIASAAGHAGEIIRRLRGFARRTESTRCRSSIAQLINESIQLVSFEARRHRVVIRQDFPEALPDVHVDRVEIQQVLVNLVRNACEALEESDVGHRRVVVAVSVTGGIVEVSVADNGPGLPPDEDFKLFDAFVTTKPEGLGMGLAISRTIVETHGGQLGAVSNPGGGATFRFTLPVAKKGGTDAG